MIAALGGCSRTGPEPRAEPARTVDRTPTAPDASLAAVGPADARPILAWTDEQALRELTRSCAFTPPAPPVDFSFGPRTGPLSCALHFEQACVADPCFHEDEEACKHECVATCDGCGASCVTSCDSCKTSCKDDVCRRKCAESCGQCRQGCLTSRDRCSTAHCTEVYKECRTKLVSTWLAKGCDAVCARCTQKCPNGDCDCWEKGAGAACHANPMLCPEMFMAPERRELDPKWKANHCEDVCAKVWACAKAECAKSGCEPMQRFDRCAQRTPGTSVCGVAAPLGSMRCPEPQEEE